MAAVSGRRSRSNCSNALAWLPRARASGRAPAILEAAIQALAVKRHDRVRRIPEQQHASVDLPALAIHGAELALRMRCKLLRQIGDRARGIGELPLEERLARRRHPAVDRSSVRRGAAGTASR